MVLESLGSPGTVWVAHAGALALWHAPLAYGWALEHEPLHALEHVSFVGTACLFWWTVLPGAGRHRLGHGAAVLYVSAFGVLMGICAAILTFARTPWYADHIGRTTRWGLTPLDDQQVAGLIMWIPAGVVYLGAALWCFAAWFRGEGLPVAGPPRHHEPFSRVR